MSPARQAPRFEIGSVEHIVELGADLTEWCARFQRDCRVEHHRVDFGTLSSAELIIVHCQTLDRTVTLSPSSSQEQGG